MKDRYYELDLDRHAKKQADKRLKAFIKKQKPAKRSKKAKHEDSE